MQTIWMKYIGSRPVNGGISEDFEHEKIYFGPENDWRAEVPVLLAGLMIQSYGIDKFLPCLAPFAEETEKELRSLVDKYKEEAQELLLKISVLKKDVKILQEDKQKLEDKLTASKKKKGKK